MSQPRRLTIVDDAQRSDCGQSVCMNIAEGGTGVPSPDSFQGTAAVVTLGCAKNQVDSEVMLGVLRNRGFQIVSSVANADVAIVNTCGFLESALTESIDCILEVSELKRTGRLRKLIVAGCAVSRYRDELSRSLPEADAFLSTDEVLAVGDAASGVASEIFEEAARPYFLYDESMPRQLDSERHSAYVKIAEGCNRPCTFCIIPKIRGTMRSRRIDSVVSEVVALGAQGVREVNLVAQDLTSYGRDHKSGDPSDLLEALDSTGAVDWIRLLYAYPIGIDERLLDQIVGLPHVCEYLDLPLQHVSESVLTRMKRPVGRYAPRPIVEFIRNRQPSIAVRTTFIVGFPGETEADVDALEQFILDGHFSSVGVFEYSQEHGTPSYDMADQVSVELKRERRERLMLAQKSVVEARLREWIGKTVEVMVEGLHEETDLLMRSRTRFQAPEVDGQLLINDVGEGLAVRTGVIGKVEVTDTAGYDLVGCLISADDGWYNELALSSTGSVINS